MRAPKRRRFKFALLAKLKAEKLRQQAELDGTNIPVPEDSEFDQFVPRWANEDGAATYGAEAEDWETEIQTPSQHLWCTRPDQLEREALSA